MDLHFTCWSWLTFLPSTQSLSRVEVFWWLFVGSTLVSNVDRLYYCCYFGDRAWNRLWLEIYLCKIALVVLFVGISNSCSIGCCSSSFSCVSMSHSLAEL